MKMLLIMVLAAGSCLLVQPLVAQTPEFDAPQVDVMFGIAEESEDEGEKLAFRFDAGAPMVPQVESVEQAYVVQVPYTEETERDGERVMETKFRNETRTRTVEVTRMVIKNRVSYDWDELGFMDMDGEKVSLGDARGHFETKQPIVAMYEGNELDPYYQQVLRDDVVIVVLPRPEGMVGGVPAPGRPMPVPRPRRR
ncbi:MAG: hypothetical protein ACR2NP_00790 [Pirellulaceae bacterium]